MILASTGLFLVFRKTVRGGVIHTNLGDNKRDAYPSVFRIWLVLAAIVTCALVSVFL